jgi:hypothetical protein
MSNDIEQEIQKQQLEIQKQQLLKLEQERSYLEQLRFQQLERQKAELERQKAELERQKAVENGVGVAVSIGLGALIGTWIGKFMKSGIMKGGPVKKR